MEKEKEQKMQATFSVWIDRENRIVSFKTVEGFEKLIFPGHDEMLACAIELGSSGYRVQ